MTEIINIETCIENSEALDKQKKNGKIVLPEYPISIKFMMEKSFVKTINKQQKMCSLLGDAGKSNSIIIKKNP